MSYKSSLAHSFFGEDFKSKALYWYLNNVTFLSETFLIEVSFRRSEDGEGDTSYMSYKSSSLDSLQPRPKKQRGLPALPASIGVKGEFVNKIHRYAYEGDVPKLRKHIKKVIK